MAERDAHDSLLEMYGQSALMNESLIESLDRLVRLQFTPEEAALAVAVGFAGMKLDEIHKRTGIGKEALEGLLRTMAQKGTMWITPGVEDPDYRTIGIAGPGLIETAGWCHRRFEDAAPLLRALREFQLDFAKSFLARVPMAAARVWAAPAALPDDADPSENVAEKIAEAGCWGVGTCSCRLPHRIAEPDDHCEHQLENCLFLGQNARWGVEHGICREITCAEALEILRQSNEDGLVHTYDPDEFICNCCADCCVLQVAKREPGAIVLDPSEFVAEIDGETCTACSTCADRCPFEAVTVDDCGSVRGDLCLGCGVCVPTCETGAVSLIRRPPS